MELRHLAYFRAVAELGSFSRAAAVLRMTQPSLSRQVMALERELHEKLLERTSRGVMPTPAGVGLQRHLAVVFAQLEQIPEVVRTASQSKELVRVGVPQGLPSGWALTVLRSIEERIPEVRVSLHEATTEEQRQLLQGGLIDLGLIHMDAPELNSVRVLTQRMGVAVAHDSVLAQRKDVTFAHFDGLKVMAHAAGEINVEESRLRSASEAAGANTTWLFRRFSEQTSLIAITSDVDAVLVTEASAARNLPEWRWIPVRDQSATGQDLDIGTWAAWREPARRSLSDIVAVMKTVIG